MGVLNIPLLADFLKLCIQQDFFDRLTQASIAFGIVIAIFSSFKPIPYGKTYTRGKSLLKVEVKDRIAVILINLPSLIIFAYSQVFYPNGSLFSIPSLVYIAHYIHRSLIYPFFRKTYSKPWPLESVLYFFIANFIVSLEISHALIFNGRILNIYLQALVAAGCIICAIGAGIHDYKLCSLRSAGDQGYRVPQGLLFEWVSGPNYLFELIEWLIYCLAFIPFNQNLVAVGLILFANITGRAEANHTAYIMKRSDGKTYKTGNILPKGTKYPENRSPYIPFIENSKYLI